MRMPDPIPGETFWAATRLPVGGEKRRKLLLCIAAYIDAGVNDPACSRLARRTGLPKQTVIRLVDQLEGDGLLTVRRGNTRKRERNRYEVKVG